MSELEIATVPVTLPLGQMQRAAGVYTTKRSWTGIDVFLSAPVNPTLFIGPRLAPDEGAAIAVQLYAIVGSSRTLVATGRYGQIDNAGGLASSGLAAGGAPPGGKHVIAYRGPAEKFEVAYFCNWPVLPPGVVPVKVNFAIVAADGIAAREDDAEVGLVPTNNHAIVGLIGAMNEDIWIPPDNPLGTFGAGDESPIELVKLYATSKVADRWVQVHAKNAVNGDRPVMSFGPLAPSAVDGFRMPKNLRFRGTGLGIFMSSTAATLTKVAAGDGGFCGWYR